MTVRDFLTVFSHGSVCFRVHQSDDSYPVLCRSDVDKGHWSNISLIDTFSFRDSRIIDICQTRSEVHVFIEE